jgi:hypothetical protein
MTTRAESGPDTELQRDLARAVATLAEALLQLTTRRG